MKKIINPDKASWPKILERPVRAFDDVEELVKKVFLDIQKNGDVSVKKYTALYDQVDIDEIFVDQKTIAQASSLISEELKDAIRLAKDNIEKFHKNQRTETVKTETTDGVVCWQVKKPVEKIGLYIPGGTAPLFSSVLMLAIPAKIAGCSEVILCTPPDKEGKINPAILFTAALCGVTRIAKIGGVQAIGAMTFGTETIPKVDKIFGPGNQYVTVAKQVATKYGVAIDMPAGPSELLVVADKNSNAAFIASDLLSQAEHGTDSQVVLVSTSKTMLEKVEKEVEKQLEVLERKEIARISISNSKLICVESEQEAVDLINTYAPEHFIIASENESFFIENIQNAGSVFIGQYTPESAGDYASGTNHTLPTNGYAKAYSGVNLDSFLKSITFQKISTKGLKNIGKSIEVMAEAEGLQAHKNAVSIRLKSLKDE
ncbi:MAG: histidinol dehydrogenase [Flavobacteriia bacterium]|nr:MAG: histidinol dehydrogenase [Flavobacteriia bacterium]